MNITILGLDAIGGSLGLALGTLDRDALPTGRPVITGWDADKRALNDARGRLMIDRDVRDAAEAVRDADIVYVCTHLSAIGETFSAIGPHLKTGAIVVDVLPTKQSVLELARQTLPDHANFVGGHPLVRPAKADLGGASLDLFKSAIFCLIPGVDTHPRALDTLTAITHAIGAKPYYIDATEHDMYVAGAQQLPILLSAALMETLARSGGWREMQGVAGEALRTATELAGSDPTQTTLGSANNRAAVDRWLNDLIRVLVEMRDTLNNPEQFQILIARAHEAHAAWLAAEPNMRPGEREFYGQPDESGTRTIGSLFFGQRRKKPDGRK